MKLDAHQISLVRQLAKDVATEIETKPFDVAADRVEALSYVLDYINAPEAAELARHLAVTLRTCKASYQEVTKKLSEMLEIEDADDDAVASTPTEGSK